MQAWRVAAASAIGTSHVASGAKCQDAHGFGMFDASGERILTLVISDGAGSAKHSETGAQCAVSTVQREIETYFEQAGTFEKLTREVVAAWLAKVQQALGEEAQRLGEPLKEFACTLLFAIVGNEHAAFFQIGDGAIVASGGIADGFSYVFWPQHGEFANTTNFVISNDAFDLFEFEVEHRPELKEVALFSDGLENLVLHHATKTVHEAFFSTMFQPVRACKSFDESTQLTSDLERYLMSPKVCDRTDDDKSLILATRMAIEA
ncbi:PP2C family serine/threonine-protein phosphatase [Bradyrhizobium cenepequi]